jgi:hypothetical protein
MHLRTLARGGLVVGAVSLPIPVLAQSTGDQARLVFTVAAGYVGGADLWRVGRQPVTLFDPRDTLALSREIRSTIGIGFGGTYFPGENLGFTAEAFLLGLGLEDSCQEVVSSGDPRLTAVCLSLIGREKSATAVALTAGSMLRFNSRKFLSPYARLNAGLTFSTQSSLSMVGQFTDVNGPVDVIIYDDEKNSRVSPALALGGGVTVAVAKGYQIRWEIRDNIAGVQRVTGPTPRTNLIPPHELEYKHIFSFTLAFEVVLERRRGRRY